ncbi:MAG: ABC transporter permease [Bacteroidota bacterium]
MIRFILRRLAYGGLVLIAVVSIISAIIYLAPVDPTRLTFGQRADAATVEAKQNELGLNAPLYLQLLWYLNDVSPISVHQDSPEAHAKYRYARVLRLGQGTIVFKKPYLRESFQYGRKVSQMIAEAVPYTIILALAAILLASIVGIFLGIIAALRPRSWFDHSAVVVSVIGISLPSYVSAMILALIFGFYLQHYTGLNIQGSLLVLDDYGDERIVWRNLLLPAIALGIRPIAIITQLTRSAMLDVLSQDYIRTAKAKGLSFYKVVFKHALRNALNPVVTAISGWFAALLAGAFFVENVFGYKGLGKLTVDALLTFDIPLVLGAVLCVATFFVLLNILVDIAYAWLDPRVGKRE